MWDITFSVANFNFLPNNNVDPKLKFGYFLLKINFHFIDSKDVFALLKGHERKVAPGETPTFTWFKSGQEFDPEDRFKVLFKVKQMWYQARKIDFT